MKKLIVTTALILGLSVGAFAEIYGGGGLFRRGLASDKEDYGYRDGIIFKPILPYHELDTDQPADEEDTPLTGGMAVLLGLGMTYWFSKRRKEE